MSDLLPRSAWGARAARPGPGPLDPALVVGLAFHWPGVPSSTPITKLGVPHALKAWQNFHMDGRGWSDIAYQVAIDQWGRRWRLRGLETTSGANGNTYLNARYGAVLLVLVQGERPTEAMLRAARETVREHRRMFPHSRRLVGHGQIRPEGTSCPGPAVYRALRSGQLEPNNHREDNDDMPTAADVWDHRFGPNDAPARVTLTQARENARRGRLAAEAALRQANRNRDALAELAGALAPDVAERVVELLGESVELELTVKERQELGDEPTAANPPV